MFSEETHTVIERRYKSGHMVGMSLPDYEMIKFVIRKEQSPLVEELEFEMQLVDMADYIIGYKIAPSLKYVFELYEVDVTNPIVGEMQVWCKENLKEYKGFMVQVIKNRVGMPRSFPVFEMDDEIDATAFKLRWM